MITCKFGGTSLADAKNIRRVAEILRSDPDRRFVIVSDPPASASRRISRSPIC